MKLISTILFNVNMTAKLIILHGIPGSGKSTLAHKIAKKANAIVVNMDSISAELFPDLEYQEAFTRERSAQVVEEHNRRTREALQEGRNVVSDNTNLSRSAMNFLEEVASETGADVQHEYVDVPPEVAKARAARRHEEGGRFIPETVIDSMIRSNYDKNGRLLRFGDKKPDGNYERISVDNNLPRTNYSPSAQDLSVGGATHISKSGKRVRCKAKRKCRLQS